MKNTLKLTLVAAMFCCLSASATIIRVNANSNYNPPNDFGANFGGSAAYPVYDLLQDAVNVATAGDTIHLEGSSADYTLFNLNKSVVIIGDGYFLTENASGQVSDDNLVAYINSSLNITADGAKLIGLRLYDVTVTASNVVIERCAIRFDVSLARKNSSTTNYNNIVIRQNYFELNSNSSIVLISGAGNTPTEIRFVNNIINSPVNITTPADFTFTDFSNNSIFCPTSATYRFQTVNFRNNLIKNSSGNTFNIAANNSGHNTFAVSNTTVAALVAQGTANAVDATLVNAFVNPTVTIDSHAALSTSAAFFTSSNAIGNDGFQRGAFGGQPGTKYSISGRGPVPVIYNVIISNVVTPTQGLNFSISTRTAQ